MLNRMILSSLFSGILLTTNTFCLESAPLNENLGWELATLENINTNYENDLILLNKNTQNIKKMKKRLNSRQKKLVSHEDNISLILESPKNIKIVNSFLTTYAKIEKKDRSINFRTKIIRYSLVFEKYDNIIASEIKETFIEKIDNEHLQFQFDDVDYHFSLKKDVENEKIENIFNRILLYKIKISNHLQVLEEIDRLNSAKIDYTKNLRNIKKKNEFEKYSRGNEIIRDDHISAPNNFPKVSIKSF